MVSIHLRHRSCMLGHSVIRWSEWKREWLDAFTPNIISSDNANSSRELTFENSASTALNEHVDSHVVSSTIETLLSLTVNKGLSRIVFRNEASQLKWRSDDEQQRGHALVTGQTAFLIPDPQDDLNNIVVITSTMELHVQVMDGKRIRRSLTSLSQSSACTS